VFAQGGLSAPAFRQAICLPEPMEEGRIERSCWNLPAGIGLAGAHRARRETGCNVEKSTLRGVIREMAEGARGDKGDLSLTLTPAALSLQTNVSIVEPSRAGKLCVPAGIRLLVSLSSLVRGGD